MSRLALRALMIGWVLYSYAVINLMRLVTLKRPVLPPRSAFAEAIAEADYDTKPIEPMHALPEKYRRRPAGDDTAAK